MAEPLVGAPFDALADESQGDARARPGRPDRGQADAGEAEHPVGARVGAVGLDDAAVPGGPFEPTDEPVAPWGADFADGEGGDLALPDGAGAAGSTPGSPGTAASDGSPLGADARAGTEEGDSRALLGAGRPAEGEPVVPFGPSATPDDADPRAHPPRRPVADGAEPRPFGARGASRDGEDRRAVPPARDEPRLGGR